MQTALPSEFKRGQVLLLEGVPHIIENLRVSGTAKTKHKLHAELRNLKTGRVFERMFPDNERVPTAELETRRVSYSYSQGNQYVFLDNQTFEEFTLSSDQLGNRRYFLKENEEYRVLCLEGALLDIVLPDSLALKVLETAPPQHGGSDSTWKPAVMEGGLTVMVPLFVAPGDNLLIDTQSGKYVGKAGG